jgi:hypothetical protein
MLVDRVILSKGLDNSLHKHPPVSRALSSLDALSDMGSASHNKHKNPTSIATSDGISLVSDLLSFVYWVLDNCGDLQKKKKNLVNFRKEERVCREFSSSMGR